jgi:hypothetical protein
MKNTPFKQDSKIMGDNKTPSDKNGSEEGKDRTKRQPVI